MPAKMKIVISASRRTDLPRFYYSWLQAGLARGEVQVANPRFPEKTYRVDLSPDKVHTIVLWSKDFSNVLTDPGLLADYNLYFHYTINNYSPCLEPGVPAYLDSLRTLEGLLARYRPAQFTIRFDPVIISTGGEPDPTPDKPGRARLDAFARLCRDLAGMGFAGGRLATSYVALYPAVARRLAAADGLRLVTLAGDHQRLFFQRLAETAGEHGLTLYACASPALAGVSGLAAGRCIDGQLLEALFGGRVSHAADSGQRQACGCTKSTDVGGYDQKCSFGCLYCYGRR